MVTSDKIQINEDTRLIDLTVRDLRHLIREIVEDVVQQAVFELEQQLPDPDEGKELKPEFTEQLLQAMHEKGPFKTLDEVNHELGLDD